VVGRHGREDWVAPLLAGALHREAAIERHQQVSVSLVQAAQMSRLELARYPVVLAVPWREQVGAVPVEAEEWGSRVLGLPGDGAGGVAVMVVLNLVESAAAS
jgi:hypothetical protein